MNLRLTLGDAVDCDAAGRNRVNAGSSRRPLADRGGFTALRSWQRRPRAIRPERDLGEVCIAQSGAVDWSDLLLLRGSERTVWIVARTRSRAVSISTVSRGLDQPITTSARSHAVATAQPQMTSEVQ